MAFQRNPNISERDQKALQVPCLYCKAKSGEPCWSLRSFHGQPKEEMRYPHKSRIKSAWDKQFVEKTKKR
jgi:hypothetical protein